ncbi:MAG: hypothetical protein ACRCYO_14055 [Bacteroidia bacterium]
MAKEALTSTISMSFSEDKILRITIFQNAHIDLEEAKANYAASGRMTGDEAVVVLVDARNDYTVTRRAQEYASTQAHLRIGTAVISENPFSRLLTNLYMLIFRPASPVRLFLSEESALEWLEEIRAEASEKAKTA